MTEGMTATEALKAIVRQFVAAADRQDFEQAAAYLAPNVIVHLAGMPAPLDFPTFFGFGRQWHAAFPDERTTFEDQVSEGDRVVSRMTSTAMHLGTFQGIPATGKRITVRGMWIDRIADGRIIERWGLLDTLGLLQQLGAVPAPSAAADETGEVANAAPHGT
jgi:steroid delta-isomerase-like uncharacterized protein